MAGPTFTVFTPTYNRAALLPRVRRSLEAQSLRSFEWLIVDDGSTDDTGPLVQSWIGATPFPIRYVAKPNGGKHTAHNLAIREARGELFLVLDSDDWIVPQALERLLWHWHAIEPTRRARFSGVTVLAQHPDGTLDGEPFEQDVMELSPIAMLTRHRYIGEKWGFHRTDVVRQFPFPEFPGEPLVSEGLVWWRIGRAYLMRFANEALRIVDFQPGGLTRRSRVLRARSPRSQALYHRELAADAIPLRWRLRAAANLVRFERHAGLSLVASIRGAPSPLLALAAAPVGLGAWFRDRQLLRGARRP